MKLKMVPWFVVLAGSTAVVTAQEEMQVDINSLSAQASGEFSETFTGDLLLFGSIANPDGDAEIIEVLIDGVPQNVGAGAGEFSFEMFFEFVDGDLIGGTVFLSHDEFGSENTYNAPLVPFANAIVDTGRSFMINGNTTGGGWFDPAGTFLDIDISPWGQDAEGFFTLNGFRPDANFLDANTDIDIWIVPAPASVAVMALGLGLVGRRRR